MDTDPEPIVTANGMGMPDWLKLALVYVALGLAWIVITDIVVHGVRSGTRFDLEFALDVLKGSLFVASSGALLGWLARRHERAWAARTEVLVNERRRAEASAAEARDARRSEAQLIEALHHSSEVVILTDAEGRIRFINRKGMATLGGDESDHIGRAADVVANPMALHVDGHAMYDALARRGAWTGDLVARTIDGVRFPARATVWRFDGDDGTTYLVVGRDLRPELTTDEGRDAVEGIDPVTGLLHRRAFRQQSADVMAAGPSGCLVILDIDGFRHVNQTAGVAFGDRVLAEIAERLRAHVPDAWALGRLGADEFGVLAACDPALVERIRDAFDAPFHVHDGDVYLTVRTGRVRWPDDATDIEQAIVCAGLALDAATAAGAGAHRDYVEALKSHGGPTLRLTSDLRRAIENDEIEIAVQPQIRLRTNQVVGYEALARWTHPVDGPISPARFVQLAEDASLIDALTDRVLHRALAFAARLPGGAAGPRVSVNLSPTSLVDTTIVDRIQQALVTHGVAPHRLEVELTETALVSDDELTARALSAIADLGVALAIDDFGTGYSSLALLSRFRGHRLKLDRSFVRGLPDDERSMAIVRTILTLSRSLGLETIGEGVETDAQRSALLGAGCDLVQGYLTGRPVPPEVALASDDNAPLIDGESARRTRPRMRLRVADPQP